jgi:hypothetical protein
VRNRLKNAYHIHNQTKTEATEREKKEEEGDA